MAAAGFTAVEKWPLQFTAKHSVFKNDLQGTFERGDGEVRHKAHQNLSNIA